MAEHDSPVDSKSSISDELTACPARAAGLLVVHRSKMFRQCLQTVLASELAINVHELDHSSPDTLLAQQLRPDDILLIDVSLPNKAAIQWIERIRQQNSGIRILAVVGSAARDLVGECVIAGANGCIFEDSSLDELREAIESLRAHGTFCSQDILRTVFSQFAELARESQLRRWVDSVNLTSRELEILQLIACHMGNKQIARRLSISLYTVKNHVHNILEKLKLTTRFEAVEYARQRQWITPSESRFS